MSQAEAGPTDITHHVRMAVEELEATSRLRDHAVAESRQIVRFSAHAIRALHRGDISAGEHLIAQSRERLHALVSLSAPEPTVYWAGFVQDAMKEHAEAAIVSAILSEAPIPDASFLGVEIAPYLNGAAEGASELRRRILDLLRQGDTMTAERLFARMESVYEALLTIDFPDAITGGLRRSTDQLRGVVERTRGDLTVTTRQLRLEQALRDQHDRPAGERNH